MYHVENFFSEGRKTPTTENTMILMSVLYLDYFRYNPHQTDQNIALQLCQNNQNVVTKSK